MHLLLIGYSGHAYVVFETAKATGYQISGYFDQEEKTFNPFNLLYYGSEQNLDNSHLFTLHEWFVAIGDNLIRRKIIVSLSENYEKPPVNIIHPQAIVSKSAQLGVGILMTAGVIIHPLVNIGTGVVCNTGSIIEHECILGDFSFVGPGAVLCGNVTVGENTFIGANSVIKQGITIGKNCVIGAGSVVIRDVPDHAKVAGNPSKII